MQQKRKKTRKTRKRIVIDYVKVQTPNLPTGYFLLTEGEIRSLQSKTKKRFRK